MNSRRASAFALSATNYTVATFIFSTLTLSQNIFVLFKNHLHLQEHFNCNLEVIAFYLPSISASEILQCDKHIMHLVYTSATNNEISRRVYRRNIQKIE